VVASFRTDDKDANRSGASNLHQFYITTTLAERFVHLALGLLITLTFAPAMSAAILTCVVLVTCLVPAIPPLVVYIPNAKRVNLNVVGKSGSTTVVASFRTDDKDANRSGASNLHQFYITTN
jgi:hypothetical protein